jgi:glutamine cyclotransferase
MTIFTESQPINKLNDMEIINDKLFVVVYLTSKIIEVNIETGDLLR